MGDAEGEGGNFIFLPSHLFIPESHYSRVQWCVNEYASLIRIQTEDYGIDCWAKSVEGRYPNYPKVIPDKVSTKEWLSLNARSVRESFNSIKGLIKKDPYSSVKNPVVFDAEDPKHIKLTVPGAVVDIDGEASRPMRLRVSWDYLEPVLFDTPCTMLLLHDVYHSLLTEESRAVWGSTMTVTKLVMPLLSEDKTDKWGFAVSNRAKISGGDASEESDLDDIEDEEGVSVEYGDPQDGSD
jgi:hypothetical protein